MGCRFQVADIDCALGAASESGSHSFVRVKTAGKVDATSAAAISTGSIGSASSTKKPGSFNYWRGAGTAKVFNTRDATWYVSWFSAITQAA